MVLYFKKVLKCMHETIYLFLYYFQAGFLTYFGLFPGRIQVFFPTYPSTPRSRWAEVSVDGWNFCNFFPQLLGISVLHFFILPITLTLEQLTYIFSFFPQLAHDVSNIKEAFSEFVKLRQSLKDEAATTKAQVKALEELRKTSEAREAKLEEDLRASRNDIWKLEARIMEKDENITKKQDLVIELKTKLVDTDSKVMVVESRLQTSDFKVTEAKVVA